MGSPNEYRDIAQDCLRMAVIADDERDRPLWVTMAQSWIQLAEHVSRLNPAPESGHAAAHIASDGVLDDSGEGSGGGAGWSRTN
jgi:hypothetical protein